MEQEVKLSGVAKEAYFAYMGTKVIKAEDILKLTGNRGITLRAKGENFTLEVQLLPTPHIHYFTGTVMMKTSQHIE